MHDQFYGQLFSLDQKPTDDLSVTATQGKIHMLIPQLQYDVQNLALIPWPAPWVDLLRNPCTAQVKPYSHSTVFELTATFTERKDFADAAEAGTTTSKANMHLDGLNLISSFRCEPFYLCLMRHAREPFPQSHRLASTRLTRQCKALCTDASKIQQRPGVGIGVIVCRGDSVLIGER